MKYTFYIISLFLGFTVFTSCEKENIDILDTKLEDIDPEVINCEMVLEIVEDPIGELTAIATNGLEPYTYLWSTGEDTNSINVDPIGQYSVTVTDQLLCTVIDSIIVTLPGLCNLEMEIIEQPLGTLTATASDGIEPFTYLWSTGEDTNSIIADSAGLYSVTVTDQIFCTVTDSIIVDSLPILTACDSLLFIFFFSGEGGVCCTMDSKAPPLTYQWATGETTPYAFPNPSGFSCTITDADGCEKNFTNGPGSNGPQTCSVEASIAEDEPGSIVTSPLGGSGEYSYTWNTGEKTQNILALHSGKYSVTISDDLGCGVIKNILIKLPGSCEEFSADFEPLSSDDFLALTPSGGSGNYSYIWSTGETSNRTKITRPERYSVTVTDEDTGCIFNSSTFENAFNSTCQSFSVTIRSNAFDDNLEASVNSGEPPYTYNWLHGESTATITASPGQKIFRVAVTDTNGCVATDVIYR